LAIAKAFYFASATGDGGGDDYGNVWYEEYLITKTIPEVEAFYSTDICKFLKNSKKLKNYFQKKKLDPEIIKEFTKEVKKKDNCKGYVLILKVQETDPDIYREIIYIIGQNSKTIWLELGEVFSKENGKIWNYLSYKPKSPLVPF
jgi:hypothetical protein